jgi:hypothetical protein
MSDTEPPYESIADELRNGTVVPFFGSAASAVYRPPDSDEWDLGKPYLPFGAELARILARAASYGAANARYEGALLELANAAAQASPGVSADHFKIALRPVLQKHVGGAPGLALIASYFAQVQSSRPALERKLREAFMVMPEPGELHRRLAAIDKIPLYVTTNYDDLLDRALALRRPHILVDRLSKGLALSTGGATLEPIARSGPDLRQRLTDPQSGEPTAPIVQDAW